MLFPKPTSIVYGKIFSEPFTFGMSRFYYQYPGFCLMPVGLRSITLLGMGKTVV